MELNLEKLTEAANLYLSQTNSVGRKELHDAYVAGARYLLPKLEEAINVMKACEEGMTDLTSFADGYDQDCVQLVAFLQDNDVKFI